MLLMATVDAADPVPIIVLVDLFAELPLRKPAVAGVYRVEFRFAVILVLEAAPDESVIVVLSTMIDSFTSLTTVDLNWDVVEVGAGLLLLGMPRSVNRLTRSFSSRALFMRSSYFYIVFCCLSDASLAASDYFFGLAGLRFSCGAKVHSSAYFSYS